MQEQCLVVAAAAILRPNFDGRVVVVNLPFFLMLGQRDMPINKAHPQDVTSIHAIQRAGYPSSFHESEDVFAGILKHSMSWVAIDNDEEEVANNIVAYLLAHPIRDPSNPPMLNAEVEEDADANQERHMFIHDLCVHPEFRGRGHAAALVKRFLSEHESTAASSITLISVLGSRPFWEQFGFRAQHQYYVTSSSILQSYCEDALPMSL